MCFYCRKSLFFHERFLSINLIDYSEPSRVPMFLICFPSADEGRRTNIEDEDEKRSNWFSSEKLTNNIYTAFSLLSAWSTRWLSFKNFFFSLTSHGQCKSPPSHTYTSIPNTYQEKPTYICFRHHFVQHTEETCYYKRLSICVDLSIFFFDPELLLQHALTSMLMAIIFINYSRCHWYRSSGPLSFLDRP